MMVYWRNLIFPVIAAAIAAQFVTVTFWDGSKQALLVAMSVIAAGVLVRLARPMPFNNPDHYEVEEIRNLAAAMSQIMRSLRALILLVLIGMFLLIVGKPLADVVKTMPAFEAASNYLDAAISASIALTVTYITLRMLQIVKSDHQLAELQADVIIRAVERKQAEQFQNLEKKGGPTPYKPPEDFGRLIQ